MWVNLQTQNSTVGTGENDTFYDQNDDEMAGRVVKKRLGRENTKKYKKIFEGRIKIGDGEKTQLQYD